MTAGNTYHAFETIKPTKQHILNCSYSSWYPQLSKVTPKSHIIKALPRAFVDYILQDGIPMPADFYKDDIVGGNSDYSDWEQDENGSSLQNATKGKHDGNEVKPVAAQQESAAKKEGRQAKRRENDPTNKFKSVHEQITQLIQAHGPMLPKLNWSAPKDAAWILPNHSLKCHSALDVYLILNASSYIVHDLTESLSDCGDVDEKDLPKEHRDLTFDLVLKEWFTVNPAWEFRCFVKDRKLVAVCQRDANFYDYLANIIEEVKDKIFDFYDINLKGKFPDPNFVFDVYLPEKSDKVWLIDINPFARKTDSLLYSWNEILSIDTKYDQYDDFDLRLVNKYSTARFACKEHSENQVPKDMVDAAADTGAMIELMKAYYQQQLSDDDEE